MVKPAPQRSRHLAPGDKLGKYELIRQIAIGGMAELYLARTVGIEGFEKLVVVKRILPQFAANASFVNMFLNEARLAATLHHPNIAQVYDIGVEDGDYFFAMEYVHGEDLDRIGPQSQEQGVPISMDAALTLTAGLCAGLHYAHERVAPDGRPLQIVHRDVSPSNVLVSFDGSVKLVDFGIARAFSGKTNTTQGGLKGKIVYMSPEQCRSDSTLDRRSDIYSVGTLLYELTTGRTPYTGETEYAILNQIVNVDVPPPSMLVPGYPPALEQILMRALARSPSARYTTAVELQGAIEDFAHDNRLRVSPLVLARLMSTLFPTKLEEWDNAKTQGAFFVEQHVVRTLIEAGKTPDPDDPAIRAQVKSLQRALGEREEDPTAITPPIDLANVLANELANDTTVGPPPIALPIVRPEASRRTPPPNTRVTPHRAASPIPGMPGAVPILPGTLVSHPSPQAVVAPISSSQADVTERVRIPRGVSPTNLVRVETRRRKSVIALVALLVTGGGIATAIAYHSSIGTPAATAESTSPGITTPSVATPRPDPATAADPTKPDRPTSDPAKAALDAASDPAEVAPAPADRARTAAATAPAETDEPTVEERTPKPAHATHTAKPVAKTHKVARTTPKHAKPKAEPKPKPKPEEKSWNADSVFMPVRTDKH